MNFAAISRAHEYSPNHVMNDFAILRQTADELMRLGARVSFYDESLLEEGLIGEPFIFSMVQGYFGIKKLMGIEKGKSMVVNSAGSVLNCYRYNMVPVLAQAGIPFPESIVVDTSAPDLPDLRRFGDSFWVKRGDAHAVHKEDVTLVYGAGEARSVVGEFACRGIEKAVLQENLTGDTIKFYAVRETNLFYWYHLCGSYHTPFYEKRLRELAQASAEALGLYVYGGDAIITPQADIVIIDINDWPSFAPVRDEAACEIAHFLYKKGLEYE